MADPAVQMHQDFARWYNYVSLGDDVTHRQVRWQGVLKIVTGATRSTVEALLRLAYCTRAEPARADIQSIRQAFKDTDETFEMNGNELELRVLAGACLVILMEDLSQDEGAAAALAVTTAALSMGRKPDLPMDLGTLGEAAIDRWGEHNRARPSLGDYISAEPPKVDFSKAETKVRTVQSWEGAAEAFGLAADSLRAAIKSLAQRQAQANNAVNTFMRVQDEELQMLWWLTGQRSEEYDCVFDEVPAEAQPFVFASELADQTEFLPGPPSVKAILSRAGLSAHKSIEVNAAVNACRSDWLRTLMENINPSPVSTPLHFAIQRQLETGAGQAWIPGWAASTGIEAGYSLPGLTLSELFYRERLLLLFE